MHVNQRDALAFTGRDAGDSGIISAVGGIGAGCEIDNLRDDDMGPGQALQNVVEQRREIAGRRGGAALDDIGRADVEEYQVGLIGLQPAVGINTVL